MTPLEPLSRLYGKAVSLRAGWYVSGRLESHALPRPAISVGNLTFGGTGKTPFTEFLARRFRFEGRTPAVLSRGYGRRSRGVVVVSVGQGPLVAPEEGGDEPVALARALPGVIVVVAERRADAARRAADLGADLLLLDDGFQHLAARRDVNLLLLDSRDPFGGGRLPPSGRLREPIEALRRADAIVFTRVDRAAPPAEALAAISRLHPAAPVFRARIRASGLRDESGSPVEVAEIADRRSIAVCGIATPAEFSASLAELGVTPEERLEFRDHQRYGQRQMARIRRAAETAGAAFLVTTEKDAVKLSGRLPVPMLTVRLSVEVAEAGFFPFVASRLPAREPAR
ncbi:MAG: tetraacyldisaccharide 4'-kinase [Thermoanaerobaculia bacterium]